MEYLVFMNGQTIGPFTIDALRAMHISPDTPIWAQGMNNWIPAGQVVELQSLFVAQPVVQPQYQQVATTYQQDSPLLPPSNDEAAQPKPNAINQPADSSSANTNKDNSNDLVWWILGILLVVFVGNRCLNSSDSEDSYSSSSTVMEDSYSWLQGTWICNTIAGDIVVKIDGNQIVEDYGDGAVFRGTFRIEGNTLFPNTNSHAYYPLDPSVQKIGDGRGGYFRKR